MIFKLNNHSLFLTIAITLGLTACASLSEDECRHADWYSIGYNDGTHGRMPDYVMNHSQACEKLGIYPNQEAWHKGRIDGLPYYCRVNKAYWLGRNRQSLNPVCPKNQLDELNYAYHRGTQYARIKESLNQDYREKRKRQEELTKLRNGDNLNFKNEAVAREYLLRLPLIIQQINWNIHEKKRRLEVLDESIY